MDTQSYKKQLNELRVLITRSLDGSISCEGVDCIEKILASDASFRKYYREFLALYCDVETVLGGDQQNLTDTDGLIFSYDFWQELSDYEKISPRIELPPKQSPEQVGPVVIHPARDKKSVSKFSIFTFICSAAALIFIVLFLEFSPEPYPRVEVATLVEQANAKWSDSDGSFENGYRFWTNDIPKLLKSGVIRIQYDSGVEVLIEGPANFEIERQGVFFDYGRVYCTVPNTGSGFSIESSNCRFLDLGTEFGVQVDIDGSSELHVFKGIVELFAGTKQKEKNRQTIRENSAVKFEADMNTVRNIPIQKRKFISRMPLTSEMIVQNYRPYAYWQFDTDNDRQCIDTMGTTQPGVKTGRLQNIPGPRLWDSGANRALQFSDYQSNVSVSGINRDAFMGTGYTIAAWVRIDQLRTQNILSSIITAYEMPNGHVEKLLGVDYQGHFYFNYIYRAGVTALKGRTKVKLGQWYHVVLVLDIHGSAKRLYINGKVDAELVPSKEESPDNIMKQLPIDKLSFGDVIDSALGEGFKGALDEILIFDKVLNFQEIESLYQLTVIER